MHSFYFFGLFIISLSFQSVCSYLCASVGLCECYDNLGIIICKEHARIERMEFTEQFLSQFDKIIVDSENTCDEIKLFEYMYSIEILDNDCHDGSQSITDVQSVISSKAVEKIGQSGHEFPGSYSSRFGMHARNVDWGMAVDIGVKAFLLVTIILTAMQTRKLKHNMEPFIRMLPSSYKGLFTCIVYICRRKVSIFSIKYWGQ